MVYEFRYKFQDAKVPDECGGSSSFAATEKAAETYQQNILCECPFATVTAASDQERKL